MPNDLKAVVSKDYCIGRYAVLKLDDAILVQDYAAGYATASERSKHDPNEHYVVVQVRNQVVSIPEVHKVHAK